MSTRMLVELGIALHRAGAPVHRIEHALDSVRRSWGREGATVASPTALWVQVGEEARIERLGPSDIDLGRLVAVLRLVETLEERPRSPEEAREALHRRIARASPWPRWAQRLAFLLTTLAAAVLLGGSVQDVLVSGLAAVVAWRALQRGWPLRNLVLAFLLGALGALGAGLGANEGIVLLAGAIIIVPGLSLTTALVEASEGHLASASARLLAVALVLAELGGGASLGWWLVGEVPPLLAPIAVPSHLVELIPLLSPPAFAVVMGARPRDLPAIWVVAMLGWLVSIRFGGVAGAAAGGLTVGLTSIPLARWSRIPDLVLLVPGILLLVPGTLGVRGVEHLLARQLGVGVDTGLLALETAAAIAVGVIAAQAVGRAIRKAPRSARGTVAPVRAAGALPPAR